MKLLLIGGSKSGKSHLAQDLTVGLSGQGRHFYIATMIPRDDEDLERIRLHLLDRSGMGFETIEAGRGVTSVLETDGGRGAYLLDSLTALYSNEMFHDGQVDTEAAHRMTSDMEELIQHTEHLVMVADDIYKDAVSFDDFTDDYRKGLSAITCRCAALSDVVIEMTGRSCVFLKGNTDMLAEHNIKIEELIPDHKDGYRIRELVIGGAFQGQCDYLKNKYDLTDEDICYCSSEEEPDFTKKALVDLENYLRFCLENDHEPKTDFCDGCLIAWNDVSCGVVPLDPKDRAFREMAGRYLSRLAPDAALITKMTAGIPVTLKG
ncbi:MAG: bifunctional adenosylcobinamide kinase/adenosylcobinamide-phosphate guanylyltransferase [Lachnospiraceae bacterium]|nr:bifunctional adenosylcobinamide kinase/adenosylcobinamide-phosphate guanylyltransferase [Candidatus Equihabitans merdae]